MNIKNLIEGTKFSFRYFGDLIQGEVFNNGHGLLLGFDCKELDKQNKNTNNKYPHNYAIYIKIDSFLNIPYLTEFKITNTTLINILTDMQSISDKVYWKSQELNHLKNSILPDIKKRKLSPLSIDL